MAAGTSVQQGPGGRPKFLGPPLVAPRGGSVLRIAGMYADNPQIHSLRDLCLQNPRKRDEREKHGLVQRLQWLRSCFVTTGTGSDRNGGIRIGEFGLYVLSALPSGRFLGPLASVLSAADAATAAAPAGVAAAVAEVTAVPLHGVAFLLPTFCSICAKTHPPLVCWSRSGSEATLAAWVPRRQPTSVQTLIKLDRRTNVRWEGKLNHS